MGRILGQRCARYIAVCTVLVLLVCGTIAVVAFVELRDARAQIAGLSARADGRILGAVAGQENTARLGWALPDGREVSARIELAGPVPEAGTPYQVAYDPADPRRAEVGVSAVLAVLNSSATALGVTGALGVLVLLVDLGMLVAGAGALRGTPRPVAVRRLRVQRGLNARSWLETEDTPQRWIPVHFEPHLIRLPSPTTVLVYGDVRRSSLVAVEIEQPGAGEHGAAPGSTAHATVAGTLLLPSGRVRATPPRGARRDNASEPDADAVQRSYGVGLGRQLRADAPRLAIAPVIGIVWVIVDGGFILNWLLATAVTGAFMLWTAAVRGSDPS